MTEATVSFVGNLTDDPQVRYTDSGIARATVRVAVSGRREKEAIIHRHHVARPSRACAQSLSKAAESSSWGRLQQRTWTAGDGSTRQLVEVVADELGPATALGNDDHDQGEEKPGTVAT